MLGALRARTVQVARKCVAEGDRGNGKRASEDMKALVRSFGPEPELQVKSDGMMGGGEREDEDLKRWHERGGSRSRATWQGACRRRSRGRRASSGECSRMCLQGCYGKPYLHWCSHVQMGAPLPAGDSALILRAHQLQLCTNFMDCVLQVMRVT